MQDQYNDLKTALYEHIQGKRPCDDLTLLTWLVSLLDEWVERLEGAFSSGRMEQTDFFGMFMIGIEVIDEVKTTSEFKQVFPERDWMEFKNAVACSRRLATARRCRWLREVIKTSRTALPRFQKKIRILKKNLALGSTRNLHAQRVGKVPTRAEPQRSNSTGPRKWNGGHVQICCHRSNSGPRE